MKRPTGSTEESAPFSFLQLLSVRALGAAVLFALACQPPAASPPESGAGTSTAGNAEGTAPIALVVHGGAGTMKREDMSAELEAEYRAKLTEALETGHAVLRHGGSSLDAVEATIRLLEDSPLFNAGKGAVFTAEGKNELDASIMDGHTMSAGAVAGVTTLKNPITAARAVMEETKHVLLATTGAERFAREIGLEEVEPDYFFTERRWESLERARRRAEEKANQSASLMGGSDDSTEFSRTEGGRLYLGTVGAVALDAEGHIAAGTSTGGMTYKKHGRVGDSPIIGAGTYAASNCGVSSTGHGEFFIRYAVAYDICARMRYQGLSVTEAAESVVLEDLLEAGGSGGIIALDGNGNPALVMNTDGMYRGFIGLDGAATVAIYSDE